MPRTLPNVNLHQKCPLITPSLGRPLDGGLREFDHSFSGTVQLLFFKMPRCQFWARLALYFQVSNDSLSKRELPSIAWCSDRMIPHLMSEWNDRQLAGYRLPSSWVNLLIKCLGAMQIRSPTTRMVNAEVIDWKTLLLRNRLLPMSQNRTSRRWPELGVEIRAGIDGMGCWSAEACRLPRSRSNAENRDASGDEKELNMSICQWLFHSRYI